MSLISKEQADRVIEHILKSCPLISVFEATTEFDGVNTSHLETTKVIKAIGDCVYVPSVTEQCRRDELKQMRERIDKMLKHVEYLEEAKFQV